MSEESQSTERGKLDRGGVRYLIRTIGSLLIQALIFFLAAGTFDAFRGWLLYGILIGSTIINAVLLYVVDPELLNQRGKNPEGVKSWDRVIIVVWGILLFVLALIAGLDVGRYQWTTINFNLIYVGVVLFAVGWILGLWPMLINKFFEATVRIQTDRGHQVVNTGPYRIVRHPSYLAIIIAYIGIPLIVGSLLAYLIIGTVIGLLILRTYLEDKTLREELDGYREYAQKTKYRLIPGIW
ncbi:MAG: methyltransferase family protein [Candidatus Helarchaeota archaeon]